MTAFGHFRRNLDAFVILAGRVGEPAQEEWAAVLSWKGAVFVRQAFLRDVRGDPALAPMAAELRRTSAQLAEAMFSARLDPKVKERAQVLARERDRLDRELAAAASKRGLTPPEPPTPDQVAGAIPADAVLVDYFWCQSPNVLGPPRLLAYVVRPGAAPVRIDLGSLKEVERAATAWRRTFGRESPEDASQELRRLIWGPLEKALWGRQAHPHRTGRRARPDSLRRPRGQDGTLPDRRASSDRDSDAAVLDAQGAAAATGDAVPAGGRRHRLWPGGGPWASPLAWNLAGGRGGRDLGKTEHVVLSACETGRGKVAGGEGVLGLQRAFQVAGDRTTVASLWQVPDKDTHESMREFYLRFWDAKKPMSRAGALRQAQLWVLDPVNRGVTRPKVEGPLPPYYWAAFILSGDWR